MIWFVAASIAPLIALVGHSFLAAAINNQPRQLNWFSRSSILWAPAISLVLSVGILGIVGRFIGYALRAFRIDRQDPDIAFAAALFLCCCSALLLWGSRPAMRVNRTRLLNIGDVLSLSGLCIGIWALMEITTDADCVGYQAADVPCPY